MSKKVLEIKKAAQVSPSGSKLSANIHISAIAKGTSPVASSSSKTALNSSSVMLSSFRNNESQITSLSIISPAFKIGRHPKMPPCKTYMRFSL